MLRKSKFWTGGIVICSLLPVIWWLHLRSYREASEHPVPAADGFDAARAFADLKRLVDFGPRPAGSKNLELSRQRIEDQLHRTGAEVEEDSFAARTPRGSIPMINIVAKIPGAIPAIVILGGHYDTKRMAAPFVGANDGGSSAAFLLEMARVLALEKHNLTYWLAFFDGEEAVRRWSASDSLYGSRHFAHRLAAEGTEAQVRAVIVVDMIADSHLDIHREGRSTPWLNDLVFGQAQELGFKRHFLDRSRRIEDDHVPFLELGLPAMDIIDLNYGPLNLYWHSRFDTVDKCSRRSLAIVGDVVIHTLLVLENRAF